MKSRKITLFDFLEGSNIQVEREIAAVRGAASGPNIVFIGAMHGNEPTGVLALNKVMREIAKLQPLIRGNVFALVGNLTALERGERYINRDLNRVWQPEQVERAERRDYQPEEMINEVEEQIELWATIDGLMGAHDGPFYFVDLHTTSVESMPFTMMSDTMMNRGFARPFPVPAIIGIEEYLSEPLLSYLNDLGCVAVAFEAGQHRDPQSVVRHEAMIWLSLVSAGIIKRMEVPRYGHYHDILHESARGHQHVYAVRMRQGLTPDDSFQMLPGFTNFDRVQKHQALARLNGENLYAAESGLMFMPLYQAQGDDGFFVIRKIPGVALLLSSLFRRVGGHRLLPLLPGVRSFMKSSHTVVVNTQIARWYSIDVLHFMGYRRTKKRGNLTLYLRRKYDFKGPERG